MTVRVLTGDCREMLATLPEAHFDACVTDPPYHLTSIVKQFGSESAAPAKSNGPTGVYARASAGFMGQTWDGGDLAFTPELWGAVYGVLKPGAYLLAFGGARTHHRMACAIEDAGFEIRDEIMWVYGSGFPKSHNGEWGGTALKPSFEPITMARKPLEGTVEANWRKWGTGSLNIDGCRTPTEDSLGGSNENLKPRAHTEGWDRPWMHDPEHTAAHSAKVQANVEKAESLGRWPANLIHDGSEEVVAAFPEAPGQQRMVGPEHGAKDSVNDYGPRKAFKPRGDAGSAARFFYCPKASKAERGAANNHPTVKPLALMQYLCRLVTPKGGSVLDPFGGSGTTALAADREGFDATLIELSPAYAEMARERLAKDGGMFAEVSADAP